MKLKIIKPLTMNTFVKLFSLKLSLVLFVSFIGLLLFGQNKTTNSEFLSFYRFNPERLTWDEHKKRAAEMGGHLACITNATDNEQVRRIAGGEIVWVGGIRKDCGNGPGSDYWKWSNEKKWSYTNWRAGEPNNYTKHDENRVMLWENGEWNDASLFHEFPAVYEIPSTSLVTYDTHSTSSLPKNLIVSGAGTQEVNGTYEFVKNQHKNRIFGTDAGHYQNTNNPSIFIGFQNCGRLHNKPEWNKWVIFTDKGARYAAHTNKQINVPPRLGEWETVDHWPTGVEEAGKHPAPTIHYDTEPKTVLKIASEDSQKEISDPTQTIQNKINNEPLNYYKFIPEKMTWNEHNNRAIEMGGSLASISNDMENNKVMEVSNGEDVWIGGIRKGCGNDTGADHWYWSNGKKWSYTNWIKNQPDNYHITHNNSEKSENRIHMSSVIHGQWNDICEDEQFSAVYELPLNDSVDYFEDKEIENQDSKKIKKKPIRIILGSLFTVGTLFQINKIKSNQTPN